MIHLMALSKMFTQAPRLTSLSHWLWHSLLDIVRQCRRSKTKGILASVTGLRP
jgi:hypothetical protein